MASFWSKLEARVAATGSLLCVGLDPHVADVGGGDTPPTPHAVRAWCISLITACAPYAAAFKPNAAFFEVLGDAGTSTLRDVLAAIPHDIPVILDGKRGDIATTAEAYAAAAFDDLGVDAVTVNGYMGSDAVKPFAARGGVFVLVKTSNPSADQVQGLAMAATPGTGDVEGRGKAVYEHVAALCASAWPAACGGVPLGMVVGATDVEALRRVRAVNNTSWILAPGLGAQGGDLAAAVAAGSRVGLTSDGGGLPVGAGILFPVSRGISRATDPAAAAKAFRDAITAALTAAAESVSPAAGVAGAGTPAAATTLSPAPSSAASILIQAALRCGVLRFGAFTLKSGRASPYFFNAGAFNTGSALAALGAAYAQCLTHAALKVEYDVLFGPAYKGIPLVTAVSMSLAALPAGVGGRDVPVAYNRKEAKDHGEGGTLVGASLAGKRVMIVDDVITAGTAISECMSILTAAAAIPVGVIVGLDRQEVAPVPDTAGDASGAPSSAPMSAVQYVSATFGVPVFAVATLTDLIGYIQAQLAAGREVPGLAGMSTAQLLDQVRAYRDRYGVTGA